MKGFYNATFLTQAYSERPVQEIITEDGLITEVGEAGQLRSRHSAIDWTDLQDRVVVPGFVDAHCHFFTRIFSKMWQTCSDGDYRRLAQDPSPLWVRGRQPPHWGIHPTLCEFDLVEALRPTIVVEQGYHGCALNSAARRLLSSMYPNVFDELISREETHGITTLTNLAFNEATTLPDSSAVYESAMGWAENVSRDWFQDRFKNDILANVAPSVRTLIAAGVTAICDAAATPRLRALCEEATSAGSLNITVTTLDVGSRGFFHPPWDVLEELHPSGTKRMIKIFVDGGRQCLIGNPNGETFGHSFYSEEDLYAICEAARVRKVGVAFHAMGNGAVERAVRVCAKLDRTGLYRPECFRLEHGTLLTNALIKQISDLSLSVVVQPHWIRWLGRRWMAAPYSFLKFLPLKTLLQSGVKIAGSSDCTDGEYTPPLESMAIAVSREIAPDSTCDLHEALTPTEALLMYTRHAAEICGLGRTHGTIEARKQADFLVLDGDPLSRSDLLAGKVAIRSVYIRGVAQKLMSSDSS